MQGQAMPPQPTSQPPASSNNASQVHQIILRNLSTQAPMQGWQSTVQTQYRANIIFQIFSQLRLLQSQLDLQYQLGLAIRFEAKAFTDAPDRAAYDHMCKKKLADIHEMRTKQSAGMQHQVNMQMNMPQQMQSMAQNPSQGLGPGQFQQGPPNPQQQQMMQLHSMSMQQPPPQSLPMGQPQQNMPHPQQSTAPQQMVQQPNQFVPTAEEAQYITRLANQMYSQTPPARMEAIQNNLNNLDPKMRESLARQNTDPLSWFFRNQAMKKLMEQKRAQASNHGIPNTQPAGMMNGVARPISGGPSQPMPGAPQNFEPPFDHIFGQQQDGLRSQEAGQIVVPASNPQANLDQRNTARANAQQQMNLQNGANRGLQNVPTSQPQLQPFWGPQAGQRNMNQGVGINTSAQATNFVNPNQTPANVLQGQPGGLDNQITRTPSQQTGMPNLNKAAPPGQAPNMWSQRTPQMNQAKPQGSQPSQQAMERTDAPQQRPQMFNNMPPQMQQRLLNMPEDQRRGFLMSLQKRQMEQQHQQQLQQNQLQQQTQQQQQQQAIKMANARAVMNESFPMSTQSSQPGMQAGPITSQNLPAQKPSMQNNNAQQPSFLQQSAAMGGSARQQPGPGQRPPQQRNAAQYQVPLTEEQSRQMDQKTFPSNMLSQGNQLAPLPEDVKTWGQLKEWAAQNAQTLPPGTVPKLENLQALQYRAQFGPRPPQPGTVPASTPQQQAPFAQMVSQPTGQGTVPAPRLPSGINVPTPTFQEIQNFRNTLASHQRNATDEHVRAFLIKQRQSEIAKRMQAQQAQNNQTANGAPKAAQGPQNQAQVSVSQADSSQSTQKVATKGTVQQNQKVAGSSTNQSKPGQTNKNTPTAKQQQKGIKRSSQDDVVEILNPNLANTQSQAQAAGSTDKQQPSAGQAEQKAHADSKGSSNMKGPVQPQNAEAQGMRAEGLRSVPQQEIDRRDKRLRQLMTEVGQSQPVRRPVQMTPQVKSEMSARLRELSPMMSRMEMSLPTFFRHNPDENVAKHLIQTRQLIKAQYRDEKYNLVDHFTISQPELEHAYQRIRQYFVYVMSKFGKAKNASQQGEQAQNQPQHQQAPPSQEKAPLNAANLEEQQNLLKAQRAAAMQKQNSGYGSRAPAAPTSEKPPPFPPALGPQSPHGIPHQYGGPPKLTADQLVLPQNKRRKSNNHQPSAGSTPVPAHTTPVAKSSPSGPKFASPDMQKAPVPQLSFKCGVSDCQSGQKGFATQAELEQHNAEIHEPIEPEIDDPVEFALESMRIALGLDENGKSKPRQETPEAPKMKASLSAQSHKAIKQEASTPMARGGSQNGLSQASNLLKAPQANAKSPASDASKGKNSKGPATSSKETTPPPFDPWAGSCISPEDILSSWSSLADMNSMSFTNLQKGLTPSSTLSSVNEKSEKNSPRTSDISENDAVKISLDVNNDDNNNWIPSEWFDDTLYSEIESMNFGPDSFMQDGGIDIFADYTDTEMVDVGLSSSKGRKKDEQDFATEEWLKVYAPERLTTKKGK
ncbi:MAG: hypothetical protein Q9209_004029 [Squamulea sp. 1 TL-2023]